MIGHKIYIKTILKGNLSHLTLVCALTSEFLLTFACVCLTAHYYTLVV